LRLEAEKYTEDSRNNEILAKNESQISFYLGERKTYLEGKRRITEENNVGSKTKRGKSPVKNYRLWQ